MLRDALDLAEPALSAATAEGCAQAFGRSLQKRGMTYYQARRYARPARRLTSQTHWQAGGVLCRLDPMKWEGRPSSDYVCFDCNPLLEPVATGVTRFRFSDFAPRGERRFGEYWDAMNEGGVGDALAAMAFGRGRATAALHIGFADPAIDETSAAGIFAAASLVVERLLEFDAVAPGAKTPALTRRERDVMRFLSEGKTDWEVSKILSIGEATARFHADNARRKLGASNRAHAVARYIVEYGFT